MTSRLAVVLLLFAAGATVLLGQAPQQTGPTFRVQVDAVEFDAFVTDAQGNPVTDLTREDFEILENGTPQTITSFAQVNIPIERSEQAAGSARTHRARRSDQRPRRGTGVRHRARRVSGEQALRTRRFLHRFFERYFAANDVAAVVFLGRTNTANTQDFTGSRSLLLRAVDSLHRQIPGWPPGDVAGPRPSAL